MSATTSQRRSFLAALSAFVATPAALAAAPAIEAHKSSPSPSRRPSCWRWARSCPSRRIYDRRSLQVHLIVQDVSRTTKEGRRLRRLARLAKAYEAAKEAAAREAGYPTRPATQRASQPAASPT